MPLGGLVALKRRYCRGQVQRGGAIGRVVGVAPWLDYGPSSTVVALVDLYAAPCGGTSRASSIHRGDGQMGAFVLQDLSPLLVEECEQDAISDDHVLTPSAEAAGARDGVPQDHDVRLMTRRAHEPEKI